MATKKEFLEKVKAKGVLTTNNLEAQKAWNELENNREEAILSRKERADIMKMRKSWSRWILACIVAIVFLDFVLIFLLGYKSITLDGLAFPAFIADGVIKIIGLAAIVVNFLFNKDSLSK